MTTTPTPAPEVEALIERLESIGDEHGAVEMTYASAAEAMRDATAFIRSQAARIKELEAERDDVENELDQVARHLNGALEEADRAEFERDRLASHVKRLRRVLEPFVLIAELDISDREADSDIFRPMDGREALAGVLRVGQFRAARAALKETQDG